MPTPKVADFRPIALRARDHTSLALGALVGCLQDPNAPWPAVIAAANAILDRGWGRPTEKVANLDLNPLSGLTTEELKNMIAALDNVKIKSKDAATTKPEASIATGAANINDGRVVAGDAQAPAHVSGAEAP